MFCGIQCSFEPPALNVSWGRIHEAGHLSRMRRERQQFRLSYPQFFTMPRKRIQSVGVKYDGESYFLQDRANELLRFVIGRKARTHRQHRFILRDLREAIRTKIAQADCAIFSR